MSTRSPSFHTRRNYAISLAVAFAIGVLAGVQLWLNATLEGYALSLSDVLMRQVPSWLTWGLLAPSILSWADRRSLRGSAWRGHLAWHLGVSLALALLHRPFHVWYVWYPFWGRGPVWDFVRDYTFFSLFTDVAIYWSLVGARTVLAQRADLRERELRSVRLSGELAQAKLSVLEQRLRPHFLHNTLHALQVLQTDGRIAEARTVVERLSELLRVVLAEDAPSEVTLREELRLAEPYLELMKVRFGDRLSIEADLRGSAADGLVPRLVLQPLLENAFLHGVEGRRQAGRVAVSGRLEGTDLVVEVVDDGPGPGGSSHRGSGLGCESVRRRLEARYGDTASFELAAAGVGSVARLRLPMRIELGHLELDQ